jgi:transcriptional regulator with XRE-family HTH domain
MNPGHGLFDGLGQVLREVRGDRGLTQGELARRSGIAAREVRAFERGREAPSLESLGKLLDGLGAGVWELGHGLEQARRLAAGGPEPPEELRRITRDMTEGLWRILRINWRRPSDGPVSSEPSAEFRALAAEASEALAELLWAETAPEVREVHRAREGGAGVTSA